MPDVAESFRAWFQAMQADGWAFGGGVAVLLLLVGLGEALRMAGWSPRASRNVVHAGVGVFVASTPLLFTSPVPIYAMALLFVTANGVALGRGWWLGIHTADTTSVGTVTFPLVLIPALALTWSIDPDRVFALQVAFLVLAFADPMAAWVGASRGAEAQYQLGATPKSVPGSIAFGVTSWIVATTALLVFGASGATAWGLAACLAAGSVVALVSTAVEALGGRGWDNFFVVLAVLAVLVPLTHQPAQWPLMLLATASGGAFAGAAYGVRALDASGAVAGGLFAAALVGLGGWAWIVPGLVFFIFSSALSRVGPRLKGSLHQRQATGEVRNARQVYANGGVAWILLLIHTAMPHANWWIGFLGALSAAAADTWATELGALSPRRPRSLRTGQRVPRGTSGAVSVTGMFASLGGAASVGVSAALFWVGTDPIGPSWLVAVVVAAGVLGAWGDSVVGAWGQAQYRDPETGLLVEQAEGAEDPRTPVRGWAVLTNDRVNWIGTTLGALTAGCCAAFFIG